MSWWSLWNLLECVEVNVQFELRRKWLCYESANVTAMPSKRTNSTMVDRPEAVMQRTACSSRCSHYRYSLSRTWNESLQRIVFIGLNPSTADAQHDDPTVRRCIGFARRWGYGGLTLVNLFAYRTTEPAELKEVDDPVGLDNDRWIAEAQAGAVELSPHGETREHCFSVIRPYWNSFRVRIASD